MLFVYSLLLFALGSVRLLVQGRAAALGRRYSSLARSVQALVQSTALKGGLNRVDPGQTARQQLELGLLVTQRDRLEARHFAWQGWADALARWTERLRTWKGQKLPYTMGVVDVWLLLTLLDHLGVAELVGARRAVETITALVGWQ
jgi:hypothetical protein